MKDKDDLQHILADLKATKEALKATNKLLDNYKKAIAEKDKELEAYKELASRFMENYGLQKIINYVKSSEKITALQVEKIIKALKATEVPEEQKDDIAESGKYQNDKQEPKDLKSYGEEKDVAPIKKKPGRQPGAKTSGRNLKDFKLLEEIEHVDDLKQDPSYSQEFKDSLTFVKTTVRNRLVYVRGFVKNMIVRTYYYTDNKGNIYKSRSSLTPDLIKGGKISNSVIASVVADKVIWASPLNMTAKRINIVANADVVNAQLLSRAFITAADAITPVWEELLNYLKQQNAIHGDESRLLVVRNEDKGKAALGQMWSLSYSGKNNAACFFKFYSNRRKECAYELYDGCKGIAVQTDGYSSYASVVKDINSIYYNEIEEKDGKEAAEAFMNDCDRLANEGVLLVGCMAHGRRRLVKALQVYSDLKNTDCVSQCKESLDVIQEIYRIEKELRGKYNKSLLNENEFVEKRKELVKPELDKLRSQINKFLPSKLAKTCHLLKEAYSYLDNQLGSISNYLFCSELTPDNNFQERQFRVLAASRRACLFATSEKGALAWSKLLSVCQTAVLNKIDPTLYLKYLLDEIATLMTNDTLNKDVQWSKYLPWNIDKEILKTVWEK